jgi:hypothetical protein
MATVREIVIDALTEIGVQSPGEPLDADNGALGLLRFRNLLNTWLADSLTLSFQRTVNFATDGTNSTYTVATGEDVDVPRPMWINAANYVIPGSSSTVNVPLGPMNQDQFSSLSIPGLTSALPKLYFYQSSSLASADIGTFFLWPTPNQAIDIQFYASYGAGLPDGLASLDVDVTGPPGYQEAFMYQLALRLLTPMGLKLSDFPLLPKMAQDAFAAMKRPNIKPGMLGVDAALVPTTGSGYNILSDVMSSPGNR